MDALLAELNQNPDFNRAEEGVDEDLIALYLQMQTFSALPEAGGLNDQYYLQMVELQGVAEAYQIYARQNKGQSSA